MHETLKAHKYTHTPQTNTHKFQYNNLFQLVVWRFYFSFVVSDALIISMLRFLHISTTEKKIHGMYEYVFRW